MENIYSLFIFVFGAIIGSFLNVVILRIPKGESIVTTGSHCAHCQSPIKPYDNIPILSYFLLRGKCRNCQEKISFRYPLVELLTAILFVLNYHVFGPSIELILNLILTSVLIVVTFIDFDTMIIPDVFHVIILIIAIIKLIIDPSDIQSHLIGAFAISVPFYLIFRFTGGLGGADVKLMFVSGLYLGLTGILVSFFIASITGGLYAIYLVVFKKQGRKAEMPFGPFLCLGILLSSLFASEIVSAYLGLF